MKASAAPEKKPDRKASGEEKKQGTYLMQCVKTSGFANTMIIGSISIRTAITVIIGILGAVALWNQPLFHDEEMGVNWIAYIAYAALVYILLGRTPTGRNLLTNVYGIVFKSPQRQAVTVDMAVNTIYHGITEADTLSQGLDVVPFKLAGTKNFALVYAVTSNIGYWSTDEDKIEQARKVKSLYNILEGGESLVVMEKQDNDTGMLALRDYLAENEEHEGGDLEALSERRLSLLESAGILAAGRSIQQYAVLLVKPKNVNRTVTALRKCCKTMRPATHPLDVLFAAMGYEGGESLLADAVKGGGADEAEHAG